MHSFQILAKCLERGCKNPHHAHVLECGAGLWNEKWCLTCTGESVVSGAEGMQLCPGTGEDWILSGEDFLVSRPEEGMGRDGC